MLPEVAMDDVAAVELAAHDLAEFEVVFAKQRARALRIAYVMTGDGQVAEDAVAEAFARTYARWVKGHVRDPEQYVHRAVVNEVRSVWRRRAVRRRHDERAPLRELTGVPQGPCWGSWR